MISPSSSPPSVAGPSRQSSYDSSTPRRSTSLTQRQRDKMPMPTPTFSETISPPSKLLKVKTTPHHAYPEGIHQPAPHSSGPRYDYHMHPPSPYLRRSNSEESGQRSRSYTVPSARHPPGREMDPKEAALLQNVREKMRGQDQEAMMRLRMEMASQASKPSGDMATPLSPIGDRFPPRNTGPLVGVQQVLCDTREGEDLDIGGRDMNRTPRPLDVRGDLPNKLGNPFTIAVIGKSGVGKTTVINRATKSWGVSEPVITNLPSQHRIVTYHSQVEPGGKLKESRTVTYLELDITALNTSTSSIDNESLWAEGVGTVSGVILCYDATQARSLEGIPESMNRLAIEGIPMIILACKSDPGAPLEVVAAYANSLGEAYNVGLIEVTSQTQEGKSKMRNGLRWLLFKLEQRDRKLKRHVPHLDLHHDGTANGSPIKPLPPDTSAQPENDTEHDIQSPSESEDYSSSNGERIMWGHDGHLRGGVRGSREMRDGDQRSSSGSLQWIISKPVVKNGSAVDIAAVVDEREDVSREGGDDTLMERIISDGQPKESTELGSWTDIVDLYRKLFSCIVTKENESVVSAFFLTYRRFCTPLDLMREFRARMEDVNAASLSKDVKMLVLHRLLGALIEWACEYPGDLVDEKVQTVYRDILAFTLHHRFLAHLTAELVTIEAELIDVDDIDVSWSCRTHNMADTLASSSSESQLIIDGDMLNKYDATPSSAARDRTSIQSTTLASSTSALSLAASSISQEIRPPSLDLRRHASDPRLLSSVTSPLGPSNDYGFYRWSNAWNAFLRYDARTFALDLTRMQWQRFEMIRPRDVFRHDFGKEREGSVGYSIEFFNHISRWVSTMILANPKPKHRARTYERFIQITHHLRRLNNYDSLYAVISGMREISIHRLSQTHALMDSLSPAIKEFEGHVRLMNPQAGYAEYTKALQVDISQGSSAIPLLTVILGLINRLQSVRPVDIREDGMIQWDKFQKFGQILNVITTCQQKGPMITGEPPAAFQALLENTPIITGEDELFERSRMLEPPNGAVLHGHTNSGGGGGGVLKKLVNLSLGMEAPISGAAMRY